MCTTSNECPEYSLKNNWHDCCCNTNVNYLLLWLFRLVTLLKIGHQQTKQLCDCGVNCRGSEDPWARASSHKKKGLTNGSDILWGRQSPGCGFTLVGLVTSCSFLVESKKRLSKPRSWRGMRSLCQSRDVTPQMKTSAKSFLQQCP